jgi:hypothetical protein
MSKKLRKKSEKNSNLEKQYVDIFGPARFPLGFFSDNLSQPDPRQFVVSVTAYGAFDKPIEGWSALDAKLGTDS